MRGVGVGWRLAGHDNGQADCQLHSDLEQFQRNGYIA